MLSGDAWVFLPSHLRHGDVLVIWTLDRLRQTVKRLVEFVAVAELQEPGAQFRSLTDGIDTTTPASQFFFQVTSSLAQCRLPTALTTYAGSQ